MEGFAVNRHELPAGVARLELVGEVDMAVAVEMAAAQQREIDAPGTTGLAVDLQRVTFLDSTGVAALVTGMKAARQGGIGFLVTNPHHMVRTVLEVTGVLGSLNVGDPAGTANRAVDHAGPANS